MRLAVHHLIAAVVPLLLIVTSCDRPGEETPSRAEAANTLTGAWLKQGDGDTRQLMILDPTGELHLIGFDGLQGNSWQHRDGQLHLTVSTRNEALTLDKLSTVIISDDSALRLDGEHRLAGNYQADSHSRLLQGTLNLPEGSQIESGSVLALTLESIDGNVIVRQLSLIDSDATSFDYRIYHDTREQSGEDLVLQARIIDGGSERYRGSTPIGREPRGTMDLSLTP